MNVVVGKIETGGGERGLEIEEVGIGEVVVDETKVEGFEIFRGDGFVDRAKESASASIYTLKVFEVLLDGAAGARESGGLFFGERRFGGEGGTSGEDCEEGKNGKKKFIVHKAPGVCGRRK